MSAGDARPQPSSVLELLDELERGGAGRPAVIARRLGARPDRERAALFADGVHGHTHEIGFWWVA